MHKELPRIGTKVITLLILAIILISGSIVVLELSFNSNRNSQSQNSNLPSAIGDFSLVSNITATPGKTVSILYIGSEACPFCAAESWPLYLSLSAEGGTWHNLSYAYTDSLDKYPLTPEVAFVNASYSDPTIEFTAVELSDNNWFPLEKLNKSQNETYNLYDPDHSIPFVLIDGVYLHIGSSVSPLLLANMSGAGVMSTIRNNSASLLYKIVQNESKVIQTVISTLRSHSSSEAVYTNLQMLSQISSYGTDVASECLSRPQVRI